MLPRGLALSLSIVLAADAKPTVQFRAELAADRMQQLLGRALFECPGFKV